MTSASPRSRRPLLAAPAFAAFTVLLLFGVQSWVWLGADGSSLSSAGLRAGASQARAGRPAEQPMQQPGPAASPEAGRLALPWLARGHPTPAPKPSSPPPAGPAVLQGLASAIEVGQGIAYIGAGTVLQVVDVRDPRDPRLLGRSTAPDRLGKSFVAQDIVVAGTTVYMISMDEGAELTRVADNSVLLVFDVANPAAPRLVQDLGLIDIAYVLFTQGDWLYVGGVRAAGDSKPRAGLLTFDASQSPLQAGPRVDTDILPIDTARLDAQHMVLAGAVLDDSLDERASLGVWNFSQLGRPEKLRTWIGSGAASTWLNSIAILQGRVYAIGSRYMQVLDVSRSDEIHVVAEVQVEGQRRCDPGFIASTETVAVALGYCSIEGSALFTIPPLAEGSGGELTIPSLGLIAFSMGDLKRFTKPIAREGDLLYILANAIGGDTFRVVDVSQPEAPVVIGRLR